MEGLVETDDDILALYNPKAKTHSQLIETEIELTDKESRCESPVQKPTTEANIQNLDYYSQHSSRRSANMMKPTLTPKQPNLKS